MPEMSTVLKKKKALEEAVGEENRLYKMLCLVSTWLIRIHYI